MVKVKSIAKRFKSKTKTYTYLSLKWYPLQVSAALLTKKTTAPSSSGWSYSIT